MKQYQQTQLAIESTLSTIISIIEQGNEGFELKQGDVNYIQSCLKQISIATITDMKNKMSDMTFEVFNMTTKQCENFSK
jgi:hypothetical protein